MLLSELLMVLHHRNSVLIVAERLLDDPSFPTLLLLLLRGLEVAGVLVDLKDMLAVHQRVVLAT
jgi:hypothetical protein